MERLFIANKDQSNDGSSNVTTEPFETRNAPTEVCFELVTGPGTNRRPLASPQAIGLSSLTRDLSPEAPTPPRGAGTGNRGAKPSTSPHDGLWAPDPYFPRLFAHRLTTRLVEGRYPRARRLFPASRLLNLLLTQKRGGGSPAGCDRFLLEVTVCPFHPSFPLRAAACLPPVESHGGLADCRGEENSEGPGNSHRDWSKDGPVIQGEPMRGRSGTLGPFGSEMFSHEAVN